MIEFLFALNLLAPSSPAVTSELVVPSQPVYRRFQKDLPRRHDRGGLFRLEAGTALVSKTDYESGGFTFSGSVAVGWLPWSGTALHLTGFGWGTDQKGQIGVGPGFTFFFAEESSIFVSASAGPMLGTGKQVQAGIEGQIGFYGWTGDSWSMGLSLLAGGEAFDLDGDGKSFARGRLGLRVGVQFN